MVIRFDVETDYGAAMADTQTWHHHLMDLQRHLVAMRDGLDRGSAVRADLAESISEVGRQLLVDPAPDVDVLVEARRRVAAGLVASWMRGQQEVLSRVLDQDVGEDEVQAVAGVYYANLRRVMALAMNLEELHEKSPQ